jgi:methionyl-tRNA formyltransferase
MKTQIVFFGSSDFSLPVLQKLTDSRIPVYAVVTGPDKPAGRHLTPTPNPVKNLAQKNHLPVYSSHKDFIENCKSKINNYIGLVAAYGRIIPPEVLNIFDTHIYNIHPSLLPKYRGPSPLQQQLLDGISQTGVTIIRLDEKMDHGPVVLQQKDVIKPDDTAESLGHRLFAIGGDLFIKNLLKINNCKLIIQNDSRATYTNKLTRRDGFIPWEEFAQGILKIQDPEFNKISDIEHWTLNIERKLRAFTGWPGIWTIDPSGKRFKLLSINPLTIQEEGKTPMQWPLSPVPGL